MPAFIRYSLHVVLWIFLYFLPYLLSFKGRPNMSTIFSDSGDLIHLISFIFLVIYTYINYYLFVPQFYIRKKYLWYILLIIVCAVIVIKVPQFFGQFSRAPHSGPPGEPPFGHGPPRSGPPDDGPPIMFGMNYNIILFLITTFAGISIQYQMHLLRVEKEKLSAELSFLKAQINPHFLFNTLNSIYSLVIEKSDDAPNAIIQLSELMRYVFRDSDADFVELDKEINYIGNYVSIQRNRLGDTVKIVYNVDAPENKLRIAPLLLMSFIENAFKYGVNPDKNSEIVIAITTIDSKLGLTVSNTKVAPVASPEGGIGLKNATARLHYLYPGKSALHIEDDDTHFSVNLTIDLA
ncbi:MAG: histidine kinase [Chitinophagaceae bacterium]